MNYLQTTCSLCFRPIPDGAKEIQRRSWHKISCPRYRKKAIIIINKIKEINSEKI